jgi:hypothetical protein
MTREIERPDILSLAGVRDDSGRLDRLGSPNRLVIPASVSLNGRRLNWQHDSDPWSPEGRRAKIVVPGATMLEDFTQLDSGSDLAIERYARKWGVLGICRHGLPRTHRRKLVSALAEQESFCKLNLYRSPDALIRSGWEPLSRWRDYASKAKLILKAGAQLHLGEAVKDKAVATGLQLPVGRYETLGELLRLQIACVRVEINRWLMLGAVRPHFKWSTTHGASVDIGTAAISWPDTDAESLLRYSGEWQGTTLFGALGVQLLMAVSRSQGFASCSECGTPFIPTRRPAMNSSRYCSKCGKRAAWRRASSKYRASHK